jgi:hypothetical protein
MSKVSFFNAITSTAPKVSKDVGFFLDRIKSGESKNLVSEIRTTTDEDKQQELKRQLPVVTFNGTFSNRSKAGFKKPSGLMVMDFDHVKDLESSAKLRDELSKDNHIFAAWISPRFGVKALYRIIDVDNDGHLKKVFEQIKERYPEMDDSGKDISRACFESYDPDIYVNLNAEVFIPEVRILPHEDENIGQITNIPLTDGDEIANRLVRWFQNKYDNSQRNNSLFKIAAAFNDFGVDRITAVNYCIRYAEKDFKTDEIQKIVESAYKNTAQFGTKHFEDAKRVKKLANMVMGGKKASQIQKEFKDIDPDKLEQEIGIIKETIKVEQFWEFNYKGDVIINAYKFKLYLESLRYFKYYPVGNSKAFVFITKDDNFLEDVNEFQMKDKVMGNLLANDEIEVFNCMAENTKLFTHAYLSMIETAHVELEKDGKDYAMLYFQNKAVKVFADYYEIYNYEELERHIWRDQVIKRDFVEADHHESMFRSFVWFIAGQETERYNTMKSIIGYLLHSHKTSADNKAIILNDETISDHPNGGSGKGILTNAIGQMKKVSTIDGKNFDFNKSFPYQTVSTDCQVLAFDDVKKNFNFESLFSLITEGITIEYKGKDAVKLPVSESPKVLISTNYTLKAEGGSFERRMFEVELSSYFNAGHSPQMEFGCMLFQDWNLEEWARFDHFMINCLQYYLEHGLVAYEHKNLKLRKLINNTSREFVQWMEDKVFKNNQRIDYKVWLVDFMAEHEDFKKWLTQRTFNQWLKNYFDFKEIEMKNIVSNGIRFYELFNEELDYDNSEEEAPF